MKSNNNKEFEKYLDEEKKKVDALMKRAEEASKRFDDIVREFRQGC
ncbi:hypothetical protein HZC31_06570 [Candidatus Woesearchaeota archaeon]|nr:hypothetical protein [Candidatus Woesearchaeota archaeon]